jgi:hypothetical protein
MRRTETHRGETRTEPFLCPCRQVTFFHAAGQSRRTRSSQYSTEELLHWAVAIWESQKRGVDGRAIGSGKCGVARCRQIAGVVLTFATPLANPVDRAPPQLCAPIQQQFLEALMRPTRFRPVRKMLSGMAAQHCFAL